MNTWVNFYVVSAYMPNIITLKSILVLITSWLIVWLFSCGFREAVGGVFGRWYRAEVVVVVSQPVLLRGTSVLKD